MSRETPSYVSLLLCAAIVLNAERASGISEHCLELDIDAIENYLSGLNLTDVPTVKMMNAGFKCPTSTLPFGTLKSDWARLLLLQEAQPDGSIIKLKLVRLMRILIIGYYQMEERIDLTDPAAKDAKKSLEMTIVSAADETSQPHNSSNNSLGVEIQRNNTSRCCSCADPLENASRTRTKSNATVIEIVTMRNLPGPAGATKNVPSSIDSTATTSYYPGSGKKAAFRILGDCLRQSLKDDVTRRQSRGKMFEIVKDKERESNEINDRGRDNRTVIGMLPSNEFWRYVMTFPAKAPLAVGGVTPTTRMRRLSKFRTSPQKSRKRVKLNNDIYESFKRSHGVAKNA